jgi:hypothetical protein
MKLLRSLIDCFRRRTPKREKDRRESAQLEMIVDRITSGLSEKQADLEQRIEILEKEVDVMAAEWRRA